MAVSVLQPPEAIWGYDTVTSAYTETPQMSWQRISDHIRALYPDAAEAEIVRLIGRSPDSRLAPAEK